MLSLVVLVLVLILIISIKKRKLTIPAALMAAAIGVLVLLTAQLRGILMLMTFFVISVMATAHKKHVKAKIHPDDSADKGRNTMQVLANGGVAALTALLIIIDPEHIQLYQLMMAASLASALADTLSSELGMVYGRRFFNIITFKKEARGLDGVVSMEGLCIGALGAVIIAFIYNASDYKVLLTVIIAGVAGNTMDSILGATLERKHWIGNDIVNCLNTLFAALVALGIMLF